MLGVVGEWPLDPDFCRVIFAHSGPPIYSTRHSTLHRQLPSRRQRTARKEKRGEGVFAFCLFSSSSSFLHSSFLIPLSISLFILRFHSSSEFFLYVAVNSPIFVCWCSQNLSFHIRLFCSLIAFCICTFIVISKLDTLARPTNRRLV